MNKYNQSKIYKIISPDSNLIYVGSTTRTLKERLQQHNSNYKSYLKGKHHYLSSYELIKTGNFEIILLEEVSCETNEELLKRERYYIEINSCCNKCIPGMTGKESSKKYREVNKEQINEKKKKYYEVNKEQINEKANEKITCECGIMINKSNKARHLKTIKHKNYLNSPLPPTG